MVFFFNNYISHGQDISLSWCIWIALLTSSLFPEEIKHLIVRLSQHVYSAINSDFLHGCHVLSKVEENKNLFWVLIKLLSQPKLLT